jgi:hypothetical protein
MKRIRRVLFCVSIILILISIYLILPYSFPRGLEWLNSVVSVTLGAAGLLILLSVVWPTRLFGQISAAVGYLIALGATGIGLGPQMGVEWTRILATCASGFYITGFILAIFHDREKVNGDATGQRFP